MLKVTKSFLKKVQENMTVPEGFDVVVTIDDLYNNNETKGLTFSIRKKEGPRPKYVEDIFDFGIWFWCSYYGERSKTFEEYLQAVNNVLSLKAGGWEKLLAKEKKNEEKAKEEAEKEAKKAEKKRKKKNG